MVRFIPGVNSHRLLLPDQHTDLITNFDRIKITDVAIFNDSETAIPNIEPGLRKESILNYCEPREESKGDGTAVKQNSHLRSNLPPIG